MNKDTHFGFEKVSTEEKQEKVNSVFTSVAENYDLMNDVCLLYTSPSPRDSR